MSKKTIDIETILRSAQNELKLGFKKFDLDNSGSLSKNQFAQLMKRITGSFNVEDPTITDIDDLMSAVDMDGDGRITEEEFNQLVGDIINILREEIQFQKLAKRS